MKNESYYEESESYNKNIKKIDRVLKFDENPNSSYPNIHKKISNKIKSKNKKEDNDHFDLWLIWYIFVASVLLTCVLYFFFFVAFPSKRANILVSEFGKINKKQNKNFK
jgi:hypothetical protein